MLVLNFRIAAVVWIVPIVHSFVSEKKFNCVLSSWVTYAINGAIYASNYRSSPNSSAPLNVVSWSIHSRSGKCTKSSWLTSGNTLQKRQSMSFPLALTYQIWRLVSVDSIRHVTIFCFNPFYWFISCFRAIWVSVESRFCIFSVRTEGGFYLWGPPHNLCNLDFHLGIF